MRIQAIRSFPYGGKHWVVGDTDEVRNDHAKLLIAMRRAIQAPAKVAAPVVSKPVAPVVEPVAKPADTEPVKVIAEEKPKRQYIRRDMKADD